MSSVQLELEVHGAYRFDLALGYLRSSPSAVLERISADAYQRAFVLAGSPVLMIVSALGTPRKTRLLLRLEGRRLDAAVMAAAERLVRRVFSLDERPDSFMATAGQDRVFRRSMQQFDGLRPVLIADPYECLLWAVIGQQVNVAFARKLKVALIDICASTTRINRTIYPILPSPDQVASLQENVLRQQQFSRQKAAYLVGLSRAIADGELDLDALRRQPAESVLAEVTQHKGVGRWTAEYLCMRGFGHKDIIPAADLGLRRVIGNAYGFGAVASEEQVRRLAKKWTGWRSWAAFYWWFLLQREQTISLQHRGRRK